MQRLFLLIAIFLASGPLCARAQEAVPDLNTMPLGQLERLVPDSHPYGYFILAIRSFNEGAKDEGVRWLYVGQLRWRFHIAANPGLPPDGDPALLASMMETIGRPINEWAGGDVGGLIASMQGALAWDAAQPNGFTDRRRHPAEYERVRSGLRDQIAYMETQRGTMPAVRARNGLENRSP